MSWLDALDRLIADSWKASRDESAVLLDSLLALSLAERWDLFAARDPRLMGLSDDDYNILFHSLNIHAVVAHAGDQDPPKAQNEPIYASGCSEDAGVPEEGTSPEAPEETYLPAAPPFGGVRHGRPAMRRIILLGIIAIALVLVGAILAAVMFYMRTTPAPTPVTTEPDSTLTAKLDQVVQDEAQMAQHLIQIDNRVSELSTSVDHRFDATLRAVRISSALDRLSEAIDRGGPFSLEYSQMLVVVAGLGDPPALTQPLKRLETAAVTGVSSLTFLRDQFDDIAPRLVGVTTARDGGLAPHVVNNTADQGFFGWLGRLVGATDNSDSKRFRVAINGVRATLGLGDLVMAVHQVEELHAWPAGLVGSWLEMARGRLDALAALGEIRQAALSGAAAAAEK